MSKITRVLIVDDSGLTRDILKKMLELDTDIHVIGSAENGKIAIKLVQELKPDVVIMDINMPVMNGFEATEMIMAYCPTPILILSSVIDKSGKYTTFNALASGAVDVMLKPSVLPNDSWDRIRNILTKKVKLISSAKVITHVKGRVKEIFTHTEPVPLPKQKTYEIIGIGASIGGPSIVMQILKNLPHDYNLGILVVQHMAEGFINSFAEWIGNACKVKVRLAKEGDKLEKGHVLIAPDGYHTIVYSNKTIGLMSGEMVNGVKPSVDILFKSIAEVYGKHAIGILLTGMGVDGAEGLQHIKNKGGITIAQSEKSCAVFGMPKAAIERGSADKVLSVEDIIHTLNEVYNSAQTEKSEIFQ